VVGVVTQLIPDKEKDEYAGSNPYRQPGHIQESIALMTAYISQCNG
jgi:hypothetical protein